MFKFRRVLSVVCSLLFLTASLFLGACAPPATGPASSLERRLQQLEKLQQQQAEQLSLIQQQLSQLQPGQPATNLPQPSNSQQSEMVPAAISQEVTELADSASSYLAAFSNLAAGRYAAAEAGFINFLKKYPEHQYSLNALYWLASAQLSQGKLQAATSNLRQIIIRDGDRAPAALALLAKTYRQRQMFKEAEDVLEQLRSRYPDSSEAQQLLTETEPK